VVQGLVLEGGGARGAYQIGAVGALYENGAEFGGVAGSSIGALNGALIAQGDWEKCLEWWQKITLSQLFDIDENVLHDMLYLKLDLKKIGPMRAALHTFFENKGLDTTKIRRVLTGIYDEQKLRASPIDFGMVTLKIPNLQPMELFKDEIPEGKLIEYLMASANMPVFKIEPISGEIYVDGGFCNNLPVNMLYRRGYRDILVIRTYAPGVVRRFKRADLRITELGPSENLGNMLDFSHERIMRSILIGRCDALRLIKGLAGRAYYILKPPHEEEFFSLFTALHKREIKALAELMKLPQGEPKRLLFEKILPAAARTLGLPPSAGYREIALALLEQYAKECGVERLHIFSFSEFVKALRNTPGPPSMTSNAVKTEARIKRAGSGMSPQALSCLTDAVLQKLG